MARPPARCGTESGYRRHRRLGDPVCDACRMAWTDGCRRRGVAAGTHSGGARRPLQPCGTSAAWQRHQARGETPCEPCSDARRRDTRERARVRQADPQWRARRYTLARAARRARREAAGLPVRKLPTPGTKSARERHSRRGEPYCLACAWSVAVNYTGHLAECGTPPAAERHRDRGETCETCRVNGRHGRTPTEPCGTPSALRRHEYHREKPCDPCREVQRRIRRERRARERAQREQARSAHTRETADPPPTAA